MTNIATTSAVDQMQLVKLIDSIAHACRARDLEAAISHYSKNVHLFDVVEPLEYIGVDSVRARMSDWFAQFDGNIEYEVHDLRIAAEGDVAFCYSLNHVTGLRNDGQRLDMWFRTTICLRKMDAGWMIIHEHQSVPLNPRDGHARVDLKPERTDLIVSGHSPH